MSKQHELGQYFTTSPMLQNKVSEFILNNPETILEPCIGHGDLISCISKNHKNVKFDMYEIDDTLDTRPEVKRDEVVYCDFMQAALKQNYKTIIGNPPYVRTKKGNLYLDFTRKCYEHLEDKGELIFIVPSDFFKLTSASNLLMEMMQQGTFTHVFHPHDERLFENASIDVIVFRYCKDISYGDEVIYNGNPMRIMNTNGLITFREKDSDDGLSDSLISEYFDVYVGLVSGKENVYRNDEIGNIDVLHSRDKTNRYIFVKEFPCENQDINHYLMAHKDDLISRKIRKFNESNWFEWGAPRNLKTMETKKDKHCIYMYNLTRKSTIAFHGKVQYFGGNLTMLVPKSDDFVIHIDEIVEYLNSDTFKKNYTFAGRFKIGHRQICNSYMPKMIDLGDIDSE